MDLSHLVEAPWRVYPAAGLILLGLVVLWRGLAGERGLLRRRIAMARRIEGFQMVVLGSVVASLGAAWVWEARWLLVLALGIGFVELRESSTILGALRRAKVAA